MTDAVKARSSNREFQTGLIPSLANRRAMSAKYWKHAPSVWFYKLRSGQEPVLAVALLVTFLAYFYAADLKGIWNDDAVRLTIANGGIATASLESRHPGDLKHVIKANGIYATQPAYLLLVNRILHLTQSYSVIPIVTTNLFIFLFSAAGIHLLARRLLPAGPRLLAVLFYLWNGFAMVHVLQVREYPLILFFLVYNTLFFYQLFDPHREPTKWTFWLVAGAYCLSAAAAFYTTKWAPFFLWPQAAIAALTLRRKTFAALTALGSLGVAALLCLPWVLSIPKNSVVFMLWDKRAPSLKLLFTRLYGGTEHLLIGSQLPGRPLLQVYYWIVLLLVAGGMFFFASRLFRERFEIQHLVLTVLGFLAFQIAYFFLREPLSTWPRYFILYLPYVALLIPLIISRLFACGSISVARRAWLYVGCLFIVGLSGFAQIRNNYKQPLVDHGPDFREVYRYLIARVAPRDKIVVGLTTNRLALNYYWPSPSQIQLRYKTLPSERTDSPSDVWTVSYKDADSQAFRDYAHRLEVMGYRLKTSRIISGVTVRQFVKQQSHVILELEADEGRGALSAGN